MRFLVVLASVCTLLALTAPAKAQDYPESRIRLIITMTFCGSKAPCEHGRQAQSVAWCESRFKVWAKNGQYLGLFQLGDEERKTYANGRYAGPWDQARAAFRYFKARRFTWDRWDCQP